ncbi:hypothetical protein TNCV_4765011 [Trichonephila clavipes]|nr:hypothetical protein TNCV_4765011 [Trichonephila clavipes]
MSWDWIPMPLKTRCVEDMMYNKLVTIQRLHIDGMWKFEEQGASSGVALISLLSYKVMNREPQEAKLPVRLINEHYSRTRDNSTEGASGYRRNFY